MITLILPKVILADLGPDAPFGLLLSLSPLFIVSFLFLTAPCTLNLSPYTQITVGAFFVTLAPVALLFDDRLRYHLLILYLALLSLGEALYQPKMYEVTFEFARKGREGMFLSMTALPAYLTMAVGGYLSGWLLEKYCPSVPPDNNEERKTDYIWVTLMVCSGISLILLILFRRCFKKKKRHP
jgi:hypothetical protein